MEKFNDFLEYNKIAEIILTRMYPENKNIQSKKFNKKSIQDVVWTLNFMEVAYELNDTKIYINFYHWLKKLLENIHLDKGSVDLMHIQILEFLKENKFRDQYEFFKTIDLQNIEDESNQNFKANKYQKEMKIYLNYMLDLQKDKAKKYILDLLDNGLDLNSLYLNILQEALYEVGKLWFDNKISVAKEHYCTVVTQFIMSNIYDRLFVDNKIGKKLLACAVGSEYHELGIRMVADLVENNGWDTNYLGANVPIEDLIDIAIEFKPDVIALSVTMPYHLSILKDTIYKIHSNEKLKEIPIFVGGRPFIDNQELYLEVGADGYAINALDFLEKLEEIYG